MIRPSNRKIPLDEASGDDEGAAGAEAPEGPARRRKAEARSPRSRVSSSSVARLLELGRALLGLVLVVGIAGGVAHAARRYVKTTPRFAVTEIVVTGASHRSEEDLVAIAGIVKGKNVFSTDLDAARAHLLADPWIKEARLERRLPGTVSLVVEERRAAGIVAAGDTYLVSSDGEIWKRLEPGDPTDLPIITGLSLVMVTQDRKGAEAVVRRALEPGGCPRDTRKCPGTWGA
ncbi:MAG TPA: FtsQ-type POTRA domain-containing protein, partial [Polyangiaceae bacterium]|nr:FtsQ-type POTRA domain-containing protein [Polyangiaceae bacterium]